MAFAKGRAFVILNRMAESGNSEAKKILGNLNSMSQEDLDSKLSTLFGKGGASKEGDTAPKDEKGGKAPEGKEAAPKGEKGAKEGKVVANKDFDPNKEGVQSIFGTEEENAKSKDKQVFNTMEEVAKPKEMKSAKDGIKPLAPEQKINDNNENYLGRKDAMTIRGDDAAKEKELYDFVGSAEKEMPELSSYLAEFETYIDNDDILTMQGFAEYLDAQSENVEDTPEKNKEVRAVKAFVDGKLGRGQNKTVAPSKMTSAKEGIKPIEGDTPKTSNEDYFKLEDEFETMVNYDGTNSMEVVNQLKEKYKGDATKQQAVNKLEGKEKFRAATKEYLEKNSGTSPLWAKSGMTGNQKLWDAERVRDAMFDFINDEPTVEAALAEAKSVFEGSKGSEEFINYLEQKLLGNKEQGVAPTQKTDAFGTSKEMGGGIGGGQKDLLGKKADMADPNREDLRKEMETEIEDYLTQTGQDEEAIGEAIQELKQKYMGDTQRYAALDRLDIERTGYESTPEGGAKAVEKLRAEAAEKAKGSASNPMTSATEGIKPVEGGTPTEQWAGAAKPEVKSKVTKDKEYYGELQKNMNQMLNYGRDEEIKERVSKEVEDTIEELNLVETPEGAEFEGQIDFLTRIYMPNISLAYYRKLQEISPNERQNYTLKDYLKSATATDVSTKVKQASGGRTNPQRDDVTYMRLLLDKIKKELKAKKG